MSDGPTRLDATISGGDNINFEATVWLDEAQTTPKDLSGIDGAIYVAYPMTGNFDPFMFDLAGNAKGSVAIVDAVNGVIEARVAKGVFKTDRKSVTRWAHKLLIIDGTDEQTQFEGFVSVTFGPGVT